MTQKSKPNIENSVGSNLDIVPWFKHH